MLGARTDFDASVGPWRCRFGLNQQFLISGTRVDAMGITARHSGHALSMSTSTGGRMSQAGFAADVRTFAFHRIG